MKGIVSFTIETELYEEFKHQVPHLQKSIIISSLIKKFLINSKKKSAKVVADQSMVSKLNPSKDGVPDV